MSKSCAYGFFLGGGGGWSKHWDKEDVLARANFLKEYTSEREHGVHCNENPIYVSFLLWELRGLSPNFHIHVSVSDLYILRIGPHIFLQQNKADRSWEYINR